MTFYKRTILLVGEIMSKADGAVPLDQFVKEHSGTSLFNSNSQKLDEQIVKGCKSNQITHEKRPAPDGGSAVIWLLPDETKSLAKVQDEAFSRLEGLANKGKSRQTKTKGGPKP